MDVLGFCSQLVECHGSGPRIDKAAGEGEDRYLSKYMPSPLQLWAISSLILVCLGRTIVEHKGLLFPPYDILVQFGVVSLGSGKLSAAWPDFAYTVSLGSGSTTPYLTLLSPCLASQTRV